MFTGDDDLLNLIQTEAITLVDSILEESVEVVNNNSSSFKPSSFAQESDLMDHDEHQLSHQLSLDENSYDQQQQQQFQLPLINVNNYSINLNDQAHSDEISDNFAIKSDCDIIVKSPTIESMSGKSFEDVDDEYNSSAFNDVNVESSLSNNTAANITTSPPSSVRFQTVVEKIYDSDYSEEDNDEVEDEAESLVEEPLQEPVDFENSESSSDDVQAEAQNLVEKVLDDTVAILESDSPSDDGQAMAQDLEEKVLHATASSFDKAAADVAKSVSFLESEIADSSDNAAIVRNIGEQKLKRVERKFEHLSSEVREDDPDSPDLEQIDRLVSKEDLSALQNDFSKISWDESLSATTGDLGSSTPDNDLQDALNFPGDTYRHQHNK